MTKVETLRELAERMTTASQNVELCNSRINAFIEARPIQYLNHTDSYNAKLSRLESDRLEAMAFLRGLRTAYDIVRGAHPQTGTQLEELHAVTWLIINGERVNIPYTCFRMKRDL